MQYKFPDGETRKREAAESERVDRYSLLLALALIVLGGGYFVLWSVWSYLQTGTWPILSLRSVWGWHFESEMFGLRNIVNSFLDVWIGFYPIGFGVVLIWGIIAERNRVDYS